MEGEQINNSTTDLSMGEELSPKAPKKNKGENRKKRTKSKSKKLPVGLSLEEHQMRMALQHEKNKLKK